MLPRVRLRFVWDPIKHARDESKQLVERVKLCCLARGNVLDPTFELPSLNIRFRSKLDDEGPRVLPLVHRQLDDSVRVIVSHEREVKFR